MNKNRFRIIFNTVRGVMMVVAEFVKSHATRAESSANSTIVSTSSQSAGETTVAIRPLAFSIMLALGLVGVVPNPITIAPAHADIIADKSAPKNQQPVILNAPNGVPLVNIQTPSAAGVSRNTYSQFDVSTNGAILNNSRTNVQTQLGGWVQGNPYLATGTARIILNEVNNPSYLNGYVEVAGSRAQVVIASPAGISCNGCGFINASRVTLTTGTPIMNSGDLIGYRVTGGIINFLGPGLNTSQTNYTDIIARAVSVNTDGVSGSGVFANHLNVVLGVNQVDVSSTQTATDNYLGAIAPMASTNTAGNPAPTYALDVAALGGMYAGKIRMIGTEAGLGVRNAGNIGASAGSVTLSANGDIINSGTIGTTGASNDLTLNSQGFNNSGTISSQANLQISNQGDATNSGLIITGQELRLDTSGALTNQQGTLSGQRLDITAASLDNLQGTIQQTGLQALSLSAAAISNRNNGVIGNLPLDSGGSGGIGGTGIGTTGAGTTAPPPTTAGNDASTVVPVAPVVLAAGVINISGDVRNDGGQITANGDMDVTASNGLQNTAVMNLNKLAVTGNTFSNVQGEINVSDADIHATTLDNSSGQLIISNTLTLNTHDVTNTQGILQQLGTANLVIDLAGNLDNEQGTIATNSHNLTLSANSLTNTSGSITHAGSGMLAVTTNTLDGSNGTIQTNAVLDLEATTATLDNSSTIAKQIAIDTATLSNKNGEIIQTGTSATSIKATTQLDNTGGVIASNGKTTLTTGDLINQSGTIQAANTSNLTVNATGAIDNSALNSIAGNLQADGAMTLSAASLDNTQGRISAGDTLDVTTSSTVNGIDNHQGRIAADHGVTLNAGAVINNSQASIESAAGVVSLTAAGAVNNTSGLIAANQNTTVSAAALNNADGQVSGLDTSITTTGILENTSNALIVAQRDLTLSTGKLNNSSDIQAARNLSLNASDTITNSGTIYAQANNTITTHSDLSNSGLIAALGNTTVTANVTGSNISNTATGVMAAGLKADGTLSSAGNLNLTATQSITSAGQYLSAGDQTVTAQSLDLADSSMHGKNLTLTASNGNLNATNAIISASGTLSASTTQALTTDAASVSADQLNLTAHDLSNVAGELLQTGASDSVINLAGDLNNDQGRIATNSNTLTLVANTLTNTSGSIEQVGSGTLNITATTLNGSNGSIQSNGNLDFTAQTATLDDGSIIAEQISIDTTTLSNQYGEIIQTGSGATSIIATTQLDNTGGVIASNGDTVFTVGDLTNQGGKIQAAGSSNLTMNATGTVDNQLLNGVAGNLQAGGMAAINASSVDNRQGQITAGDTLQITTTSSVNGIDNSQGHIAADNGVSLTSAANINNTQAGIESAAGAVYVAATGTLNNTSGLIAASQNTTVSAASLNNADGQVSGLDTSITTSGTLDNTSTALIIAQRDLRLTTGNLNNQSDIQAVRDLVLDASATVTNSGTLYAQGNANLTTQGDLDNSGLVAAHGNTGIHANGANSKLNSTVTGVIAAGLNTVGSLDTATASLDHTTGNLAMSATQSVTALGQNLSSGDQTIIAQSIDLSGSQTIGRNLSLTANNGNLNAANASIAASEALAASTTQTLTTNHASVSANQLDLSAHDLSNVGGTLVQTGTGDTTISLASDLNNDQGRIATNSNNLTLAAQILTNTGGSIEHVGSGTLEITSATFNGSTGHILSNGNLDFTATTATLDNGSTIAKRINVDTATFSNRSGEIIQTGSDATSIHASTSLDNTDGIIAGNGTTTLTVGDLINQGGTIQVSGQVSGQAAGTSNLTINATGAIDNTSLNSVAGNINVGGTLTLNAGSLNNTQGQVTAGNTLDVTTSGSGIGVNNTQGLIAANQALTLSTASLDNSSGTIASVHADVGITATSGSINNTAGEITAAQNLHTNSLGLNNTDGSLLANSANIDTQSQLLDNTSGTLITTAGLDLQTGTLGNDAGLIQSGGNLSVNTHGQALTNSNSGSTQGILSQGTATFTTGALNNQTGYIGTKGAITANSAAISNSTGTISSEATVALNATSLDNQTGRVEALGNINVNVGNSAANSINNQSGLLRSGQALTLTSASVDNRNTQGVDQGIEGQSVLVTADQIDNSTGAMRADNTLAIIGSGTLNNSQGKLSSAGALSIADRHADTTNVANNVTTKTLAVTNTGGTIIAETDLNIDSNSLSGDGKVLSNGDLTTKLTSDYTHSGEWLADGNATLVTTGTLTNQVQLLAGSNLNLIAANVDNKAGAEISAANTTLAVSNTTTNRGLIDGGDTFINTGTLKNLGTGRIYGDHVAIAAATLNNTDETVNGVNTSAVIAARDRLDIGAQTITNQNDALIFSAGDMAIGGSLDANHQATVALGQPQANTLMNNGATIEALGNLQLSVADLQNLNASLVTQEVQIATGSFHRFTPRGRGEVLNADDFPLWQIGNFNMSWRYGATYSMPFNFREYYRYIGSTATTGTQVVASNPGQILSGGNMTVSGNITNSDSQMIAGGTLDVTGASLQNLNSAGQTVKSYSGRAYYYDYDGNESCSDPGDGCYDISYLGPYNPANEVTTFNLNVGRVEQFATVSGTGTSIDALTTGSVTHNADGANAANASVNTSNTQGSGTKVDAVASVAGNTVQTVSTTIKNTNAGSVDAANVTDANQVGTVAAIISSSVQDVSSTPQNTSTSNVDTAHATNATQAGPVGTSTQTGPDTVVRTASPNTVLPNNSLFHTNPNPSAGYYVETDPRFANYRNWLSSDYMLSALRYDPAAATKRLGDGFYEQRLIREQIAQLTGRRFLTGYTNDEEAYRALMTNGVTFAQTYQLIPGVALSEAQIAQLTSDIVWLVERTITLADGTTVQALVPQVYVRLLPGDIDGQGTLLSGDSVNLNLTGDLGNSGTIAGRDVVSLTAENIHNLGGRISANNTRLNARNDISNLGGQISGNDKLSLNAEHDINIASTTQSNASQSGLSSPSASSGQAFSRTNLDRIAGLYVTNPNGVLVASSSNNINLQGAVIRNTGENGTTIMDAGHDLSLTTITTAEQNNTVKNSKNYIKHGSTQEIGSVIQTEGDLILNAGNNVKARAANVTSENGALSVNAANDISIEAGEATSNLAAARTTKKSGTFSSKKTTSRDSFNGTDVISSTFSGDSVDLNAGHDLTVTGSNIVGTNDVSLNAQNNVTLTTAQATHDETHYKKTKQSGLMSSGGVGVTIGSSKLTNTNDSQQVTNVGSTVGSVQGDVKINSGNTYTQTGSDVLTPQGDIDITAQQVDITNATDTYANQQTMKYKQSGLTLAITSPVISAIQTAQQMSKAAGKTDDTRMQALAAGTAALAANNAKDAIIAGNTPQLDKNGLQVLDANGKNTAENPANQVGGVNLSLSIGSSKSSSQTEQTNTTVKSSTVNAGGDVTITATGDGSNNPDTGNINVIGSTIKAANNVTLKADDEINLLAAQNVDTLNSKNKGSSASLGISVGSSGLLVTASASGSKGKTKGNGSTWTETQVQGGNNTGDTVTLNSGTDTTLKGAQVTGNQVVADVGTSGQGNLNIESLQDTNQYKDKQQSIGGSISVGYGVVGGSISYSDSKTKSNYQSVNEQSGIMAGDGGFQVNVNGNTDLKGAVIASTDKAIQDNKNSLTTQTLTTSNIENSAEYSAKGISFGTGVGLNKQSDDSYKNAPTASAGSANLSDDSSSVTVSGISGGSVSITDNTQQQALSGKDTTTTVATLNRDVQTKLTTGTDAQGNTVTTAIAVDSKGNDLAGTLTPIFDQEQVQRELNAQIQITQAFSQVAPKAVADFATNKVKELVVKAQEAHLAGDEATANQLLNEAEKWNEGGSYRIALHTALGGLLTGDMSGAAGAGAVAGSADLLNQLQSKVTEALQGAGLETTDPNTGEKIPSQTANIIAQALAELTSAGMGAAIGGTAGAGTALVVDTNNRQLHQTEIDWIKANAKRYAQQRGISEKQALEELTQQALRDVDLLWRAQLTDGDNANAQAFLVSNQQTFVNDLGESQKLFTAPLGQLLRPEMFADSANPQFYQQFAQSGISRNLSTGLAKELKDAGLGTINSAEQLAKIAAANPIAATSAVLNGVWNMVTVLPQTVVDSFKETGTALGEGFAVALNEDITQKLNAIYGSDVAGYQKAVLAIRLTVAITGAAAAAKTTATAGAKTAEAVSNKLDSVAEQVSKQLDKVAEQTLLKSGGAFDTAGNPILDLKTLTNDQKRIMGELFGENTVKQIIPDGQKLARMPGVGETGIDDLYKVNRPDVDYVIIEYKFDKSGLGSTNDGKQGSLTWITGSDRIAKAVGINNAELVDNAINASRTETWVVRTLPDGSTKLQVLDGAGNVKKVNEDISKILTVGKSGGQP